MTTNTRRMPQKSGYIHCAQSILIMLIYTFFFVLNRDIKDLQHQPQCAFHSIMVYSLPRISCLITICFQWILSHAVIL